MRLLTFQDKYVLEMLKYKEEELEQKPIYECETVFFQNREEVLYNKFIVKMKKSLGVPESRTVIPIWCWVIPKDQVIDDDYLDDLYTRYIPKCNRLVAIEMNVPKEFTFTSNFEIWEDLLFKCTFREVITDPMVDELFEKKKGAILQVAIPFIDKSFILNTKVYNDPNSKDYTKTDDEVEELQSKGEFLEG